MDLGFQKGGLFLFPTVGVASPIESGVYIYIYIYIYYCVSVYMCTNSSVFTLITFVCLTCACVIITHYQVSPSLLHLACVLTYIFICTGSCPQSSYASLPQARLSRPSFLPGSFHRCYSSVRIFQCPLSGIWHSCHHMFLDSKKK